MGYYCTVPQCTSLAGKTKNVKFHRFPRDVTMADKWNLILKRGKPYTKYSKVCSLHFTQADYNVTTMGKNKGQWKTLSKDAVPSQNLPKLNPDGTVMVIRKSRTVKYREGKKDDIHGEKTDKWPMNLGPHSVLQTTTDPHMVCDPQDNNLSYRYPTLNTMNLSPQITNPHPSMKPKKQDAFMQTDPVQSEDDDSQPNNSYSEVSEKYPEIDYQTYQKEQAYDKKYEAKDYTNKPDDYIPQTNEEYNKEAEKYALERKSLNGYEKPVDFPKQVDGYPKLDAYPSFEKPFRPDYGFQNYQDSVEILRNQQHNLQMLQEQHRINENQNFFNESHIKQEIDINVDDDKFAYERSKEQLDADMYTSRRLEQQRAILEQIQHQVKQEPDTPNGCENVMQPQGSPYYPTNNHNNVTGGYYEQVPRPGPEMLIAKQNALAAHTQLWQNTMKRPFFYSESPHYNTTPILHRYEDIPRILQ
ncbi:uncharacterized protein LOC118280449 isoform X1 [Spodoptera frugiperda]|uniref:Uncharacterized protein LOC118280449 isoform X1 n=1 Tax=Spodoptera frugiperda TaxID=7108 RepID=A0A9R0F3W4_SPOFR|nr:uncharacterized protein LOC118280449 isoform X1 [Spodoptera frugiperda]